MATLRKPKEEENEKKEKHEYELDWMSMREIIVSIVDVKHH